MKIKNIEIKNKAVLAPMAGFCDIVMRKVCDDFGAGFTISEMVSARALYYGDKKSLELMKTWEHTSPYGIQLFGFDPVDFEKATQIVCKYSPDFIDINMGCPAPKITSNGSGSALMKNPFLAQQIVKTVVENADGIPVSVKMRTGWEESSINAVELSKRCEAAGADFITVHGRTRNQMYTPGINAEVIKQVKDSVSIPVIANGDVTCPQDAAKLLDYTGCDGVMIGREALSRPWIFKQCNEFFSKKTVSEELSVPQRMELMHWHIQKLCEVNGEALGMKKARGQAALYMKGLRGAAHLRFLTNNLTVFKDAEILIDEVLKENV